MILWRGKFFKIGKRDFKYIREMRVIYILILNKIRFGEYFQPACSTIFQKNQTHSLNSAYSLNRNLRVNERAIFAHPDELVPPSLGRFMSNAHSTQISILEIWMWCLTYCQLGLEKYFLWQFLALYACQVTCCFM